MNKVHELTQQKINAERAELELAIQRFAKGGKIVGGLLIFLGVSLCLTLIGIPIGILLIILGFLAYKFMPKFAVNSMQSKLRALDVEQAKLESDIAKNNK